MSQSLRTNRPALDARLEGEAAMTNVWIEAPDEGHCTLHVGTTVVILVVAAMWVVAAVVLDLGY